MYEKQRNESGPETLREMVNRLIKSTDGMIPPQNHIDQIVACYETIERHAKELGAKVARFEAREAYLLKAVASKVDSDHSRLRLAYGEGDAIKHRFYRQELAISLGLQHILTGLDEKIESEKEVQ